MTDKERLAQLSWQILEHKYRYYILLETIISDYEYDMLEKEYEALCVKLGVDATATNMVDFDMNRPACKAVMDKFGKKRKIK
jgi:NAD-dependent DNA ligase